MCRVCFSGLLPRSEKYKSVQMPHYEPKDNWSRKRALFGQNDYIGLCWGYAGGLWSGYYLYIHRCLSDVRDKGML